jgi:hypothetical protein
VRHRREDVGAEPIALRARAQRVDVTLGAVSEVEVRTDKDSLNIAGPADAIDELVGAHARERAIEVEDDDRVGAGGLQQTHALRDARECGRGRTRSQDLERQRVEGRRDGRRSLVSRVAGERVQQRLVCDVDAVEDADRKV